MKLLLKAVWRTSCKRKESNMLRSSSDLSLIERLRGSVWKFVDIQHAEERLKGSSNDAFSAHGPVANRVWSLVRYLEDMSSSLKQVNEFWSPTHNMKIQRLYETMAEHLWTNSSEWKTTPLVTCGWEFKPCIAMTFEVTHPKRRRQVRQDTIMTCW